MSYKEFFQTCLCITFSYVIDFCDSLPLYCFGTRRWPKFASFMNNK